MRARRLRHITLAVEDLEAARATFERLFGVASTDPFEIAALGVRASEVALGDTLLQLAVPAAPDHPLKRFLQRRGEGVYNLAVEIDDLDAAIRELQMRGARVSDAVEIEPGVRAAFVAMAAAHGLSLQLLEIDAAQAPPERTRTIVEESRPEHLPPEPTRAPGGERPPLDLTPDEWSDTD